MKTFSEKSSSKDTLTRNRQGTNHKLVPVKKSVPAFRSIPLIQRKAICPCDGGCPRCKGVIQPKLTIGKPNDKYELEADRVADQIMRMPEPGGSLVNGHWSLVQRKAGCSGCMDEEEEVIQTKPDSSRTFEVNPDIESRIQSLKGSGHPISQSNRSFFESHFGVDFSQLRIHQDREAHNLASSLGARAFTIGKDICLGQGENAADRRLMAHEFTHVLQQQEAGEVMNNCVQRNVDEDSIREGDISYSTHCGWIDWGHSNPHLARNLIAKVREASRRIARREEALTQQLSVETSPLVNEPNCTTSYETNEVSESHGEPLVMDVIEHSSGMVDIILGGFGVNSSEAGKFETMVQRLAKICQFGDPIVGVLYEPEISGFSDCIELEHRNSELRQRRLVAIAQMLSKYMEGRVMMIDFTPNLDQFLASNNTREGRKKNRGVLIRYIPHVTPEQFTTQTMISSFGGFQVSAVTPTVELNRSHTEEEVLSVALTIFRMQSIAFEGQQSWRDPITSLFGIPSSSFAEEDLPSNLIGFYRAARNFSSDEIRTICDVWDTESSLLQLEGYNFQTNYNFYPPSLPPGGAWPPELSSISPTPLNSEEFRIVKLLCASTVWAYPCYVDPNT